MSEAFYKMDCDKCMGVGRNEYGQVVTATNVIEPHDRHSEHVHEWHYYDGNETEGTESICACGAIQDDAVLAKWEASRGK